MLDLSVFAKHYIPISVEWLSKVDELQNDMVAIRAIESTDELRPVRIERIQQWLHSYHVLRSFTSETERKIAEQVIIYADGRERNSLEMRQNLILDEFKKLESRLQLILPMNKSGTPRKVTSLVSKAIWCCYPSDIPIFDSYAEYALQVLCRICNIKVNNDISGSNKEYERFLEAWLHVYREIEPVIDANVLKVYPYKIRAFDSLLWYIGQPKFDACS